MCFCSSTVEGEPAMLGYFASYPNQAKTKCGDPSAYHTKEGPSRYLVTPGGHMQNVQNVERIIKDADARICLYQVNNIRHRTTMAKLQLSNHRMAIETGRYIRPYKKPNERICPLCKKEVQDEKHFLISFPVYQEKRNYLFEC